MILWDLESGRKGKLADIAQRKEKILREKISIFCLSCNIVNLLRWQKTLKKKIIIIIKNNKKNNHLTWCHSVILRWLNLGCRNSDILSVTA